MIDDRDIWRAAHLLMKRYGADAALQAAQRADELFDAGDSDGCAIWKRILEAVGELARTTPAEGERDQQRVRVKIRSTARSPFLGPGSVPVVGAVAGDEFAVSRVVIPDPMIMPRAGSPADLDDSRGCAEPERRWRNCDRRRRPKSYADETNDDKRREPHGHLP